MADDAPPPALYVSLGDSISIDDYAGGPGRGAPGLLFQNRDIDFPEWAGRDLRSCVPGAAFRPLAWDGATSDTVRDLQITWLQEQEIHPRIVTLTMGGNDLLQVFGNDTAAQAAYERFLENGNAILTDLRVLAEPNATILMGTIYDPSDGGGDPQQLHLIAWPTALAWIRKFNGAIEQLAGKYDATVADIHGAFQGHGASVGDPEQNDPRPTNRSLFYCGVVEPNAWGAGAIRGLWWDMLVQQGVVTEPRL